MENTLSICFLTYSECRGECRITALLTIEKVYSVSASPLCCPGNKYCYDLQQPSFTLFVNSAVSSFLPITVHSAIERGEIYFCNCFSILIGFANRAIIAFSKSITGAILSCDGVLLRSVLESNQKMSSF